MRTYLLLAGASAVAMLAAPAIAQDMPAETATAAEPPEDGEIIVTARRVNETLSQVPASITAFNADTIDQANINRADDFVKLTPGVRIVTSTAEAGDTQDRHPRHQRRA